MLYRFLIELKSFVRRILCVLLYNFPRNRHLVIYGGSLDLFIDNAKHLFIYNNETMNEYEHIWLSRNSDVLGFLKEKGFKAHKPYSIIGLWKQLRAGFSVGDIGFHYGYPLLMSGSYQIELWHGIPNKKIMYAKGEIDMNKFYAPPGSFEKRIASRKFLLNTTKNLNHLMSWAFRVIPENIIIGSYPRNRVLMMSDAEREEFINKYETKEFIRQYEFVKSVKGRKIIYMPTFRDGNPDYMDAAIPDYNILNQICKDRDITFFLKVHRVAKIPDISNYPNIIMIDNKIDIYPMLPLFDMVISDYSGIMFDYALLDKKIVLYIYDIEEYVQKSRGLYTHYFNILKQTTAVKSYDELLNLIGGDVDAIKDFNYTFFWDDINAFDVISSFIRSKSLDS